MRNVTNSLRLLTLCLVGAGSLRAELAAIIDAKIAAAPSADQIAFFEKSIRPVLAGKCYKCHSAEAEKVKGGLLLDTREGIRAGGDTGHAVVPGSLSESLLIQALHSTDKDTAMPPEKSGGKLPDDVIKDFEKWVMMGAPDPRESKAKVVSKKEIDWTKAREFWAFKAPQAAPAPQPAAKDWPRTEIDRFILASLETKGLKPVADSDPRALLRRVTFDLTGLPPTPEEMDSFLDDKSPKAFEKVVDRLLASPQFGERWGRHWLDVARFAESTGKERNFTFPEAWRYRDWVISAVNADQPYDQFIVEQLAGDLLPAKDAAEHDQHLIATGFLAIGTKGLNEKNREQFRMDVVDDQIDTTSRAVLGLTVACARCHDHKFDPIPQKDYYALAGIFRSTTTYYGTEWTGGGAAKNRNASPLLSLTPPPAADGTPAPAAPAPPVQSTAKSASELPLPASIASNPKMAERFASLSPEKRAAVMERFGKAPARTAGGPAPASPRNAPPAPAATTQPPPDSATVDQRLAAFAGGDPEKLKRIASLSPERKAEFLARFSGGQPAKGGKANGRRKQMGLPDNAAPSSATTAGPKAMGVSDGSVSNGSILIRGEVDHRGDTVPRGVVTVLTTGIPPTMPAAASGRLELAQWLTAPENPLTARVMVNRAWQHLFGQGLVRTPDNFGATGTTPSHPALLDHLALQFMHDGWSVKKLVRSIVLSRTYQLSAAPDSTNFAADPDNVLLWRASPRRLDAEAIRDAMLAVSGQLDLTPLAGSVVAKVGDGYIGRGIRTSAFKVDSNKRSVYLPIVRDFVPEALEVFDFAEPSLVVAARDVTNVPAQALFLMNDPFVMQQAQATAKRILATPLGYPQRIALAYQLTLSRLPTDAERTRADQYLRSEASQLIPIKNGPVADASEASWATFCQALFACAEFRYLR